MRKTNTKDRRGQFYWLGDKPYVSVTNVLRVIDKPALRYWFGKEVYLAMTKDPTLSQQEALSAPYKTTDKAKSRGTTVHSIVEAYKKKGTIIDEVTEPYHGYARAFYKWIDDNKVDVLESEKTVISQTHQYAGTLDLMAMVNNRKKIIDVKTGKDIYLEAHLQVSAYAHALGEDYGEQLDGQGVLLLGEDGTYKYEETGDHFHAFLATKELWEYINKEECEKVGYGK